MARILVVDDDDDLRAIAGYVLAKAKHDVVTACNARQALGLIHDGEDFDVVVLDVAMPEMTGVELLTRLRAMPGHEDDIVIMCTASTGDAAIERAFAAGADEYMIKPYSPKEMVQRVSALLARRDAAAGVRAPAAQPAGS